MEQLAKFLLTEAVTLDVTLAGAELSLAWVEDDEMITLNQAYFDRATVTDVISFRYAPVPAAPGPSAEIVINVQQAYEEGLLRDGPDAEVARYLAHGCHHLTGAEDDTPARKFAMLNLEAQWVVAAQAQGLIPAGLLLPLPPTERS